MRRIEQHRALFGEVSSLNREAGYHASTAKLINVTRRHLKRSLNRYNSGQGGGRVEQPGQHRVDMLLAVGQQHERHGVGLHGTVLASRATTAA
jgi:hypothetical protein